MRKITFYPRLALGNLWRNKNTYLPYLLACVVSIASFYIMLSINYNGALDGMPHQSIVKSFTAIGAIILAMFCSVLIFYTNSFLIKRRKRELGLYSILGMAKNNIGMVMFFETLFVAILALALGLAAGLLLSRVLFLILLRMVRFTVMVEMPISMVSVIVTVVFYGIIFFLTLLTNLRQVRVAKPVELLSGANQGEREPKSSKLLTIIGVLTLGAGYFIAIYFQSPLEALMYFLLAVLLVIIGTFCLFTSGSVAVLKLMRKNKNYYYTPGHFITVSGLIYRMKQNAAGLAAICILSCMVLVTVSSTISLQAGAEDSVNTQYPYDFSFVAENVEEGTSVLPAAEAIAAENGVTLTNTMDYLMFETGVDHNGGGVFNSSGEFTNMQGNVVSFVSLADYNRSTGSNETLAKGEALYLATGSGFRSDLFTVDGIEYRVRPLERFGKLEMGGAELIPVFYLVVPDDAAMQAAMGACIAVLGEGNAYVQRHIDFDTVGSEEARAAFEAGMSAWVMEYRTAGYLNYQIKDATREAMYATIGGFLFLGIYFGVIFLMAAAMIIYYKQLSEGYDDCGRYEILQKVGMSEGEVRRTIDGQIRTVFFLPLVVAIIHIVFAYFPIRNAMVIFGIVNQPLLILAFALTALAYALVYLLVYKRTARTYFKIVRRAEATR